jgi:DNA-binding MarR family transcriptional regulator
MAKVATSTIRTPELASQVRLAVLRLARRLRQHAPVDVTPSQLSALTSVVREGRVTLSQLAEIERVKPPTVTRIVDALGQRGLVTRIVDDEDRRVAWVAATTDGRALLDTIRRRRDAYLAEHLRNLSDDDRELLARAAVLLERLLEDPEP